MSVPEPSPHVLEPEEFKQLLDACPDERWRTICYAGYYAGLRQGEILALEWDDVDFGNRMLNIRNKPGHLTKSRRNRLASMAPELVSALQALRYRRLQSKYVFTSANLAGRRMVNNPCRDFAAIVKKAGLIDDSGAPRFSMHDLRRTFVTNLLGTGTDPKSVQKLAGHADVNTTLKHYAAVRAKNLLAAITRRFFSCPFAR